MHRERCRKRINARCKMQIQKVLKGVLNKLTSTIIVAVIILLCPITTHASVNIPLDSSFYEDKNMLTARGLITGDFSSTKPATGAEGRVLAEALYDFETEGIPAANSQFIDRIAQDCEREISQATMQGSPRKTYLKPVDEFSITYTTMDGPFSTFNNEGIEYFDGNNAVAWFQSQASLWGVFSFSMQPLILYNQNFQGIDGNDETDVRIHKGYVKLTVDNFEIAWGRDSLWWGPGYHGALLISNNARPFDMLKISNPRATILPWIFRYLGPFQYQLFLSELDKEAASEHPPGSKLVGLRFDFKPHPLLELGTSYLTHCGGDRSGIERLDPSDYLYILFSHECRSFDKRDSNKQFGVDAALTIPDVSDLAPVADSVKLYAEWGGEDKAYPPDRRAYILGVVFNDIFTVHGLKLISEYARISPESSPTHWYRHSVWPMTHYGRVFGHHAGTDSDDLFFELSHRIGDRFSYKLSFDKERSGLSKANIQEKQQYFIEAGCKITAWLKVTITYGREELSNAGNVQGAEQTNSLVAGTVGFDF
jgi:hypothetical protein